MVEARINSSCNEMDTLVSYNFLSPTKLHCIQCLDVETKLEIQDYEIKWELLVARHECLISMIYWVMGVILVQDM